MNQSESLYQKACQFLVGGVNSPVRSFKNVGGTPLFIEKGEGAHIYDADGRRYIDFVLSWGPLILGHRPPAVVSAIEEALSRGWTFGAPTSLEIDLAEEVLSRYSDLERIRFVSSGTEATLSALRLARGATQREHVIKFSGCYHGHVDSLLVEAGSGLITLGNPTSSGIPQSVAETTHVLPYNDVEALNECLEKYGSQIAAIILEGVAGNMGVIPPQAEFVTALNGASEKYGTLLILDEVLVGFRAGPQGAVGRYGYHADIVTFGKVVGGGFPVGAYAARKEIMDHVAPIGSVYQAGTLSGNPVAMAAGATTLKELTPEVYESFEKAGREFALSLGTLFSKYDLSHVIHQVGSLFGFFFCESPVVNFETAQNTDQELYRRFFHACLEEGISLPPSAFESCFISTVHDEQVLDEALAGIDRALQKMCAASST